ncbi:MAG: hypothetical protein ACM3S0_10345 [Acidobacteriota bacterium]
MSKPPGNKRVGETFQTKSALHEHVRRMLMLERLCSRFPLVAKQLRSRHGDRDTLRVEDEYDVQDLLHALLILEHDDIKPEVWTPGYAGTRPRTDFFLTLAHIVITAKMTRSGWGSKELEDELPVDIQKYKGYPGCRTLVCFVYDPEGRIANPRAIESEQSGEKDGLTVRVVIVPKGR